MVTGPATSNTRRSPLCGSLPERTEVTAPSAAGSFDLSEDLRQVEHDAARVVEQEGVVFGGRGQVEHHARAGFGGGDADVADFSGDEVPGDSRNACEQRQPNPDSASPKNPSPSWSSTPDLRRNLLIWLKSFNPLDAMTRRCRSKTETAGPASGNRPAAAFRPLDQPQEARAVVVGSPRCSSSSGSISRYRSRWTTLTSGSS